MLNVEEEGEKEEEKQTLPNLFGCANFISMYINLNNNNCIRPSSSEVSPLSNKWFTLFVIASPPHLIQTLF